MQPRLVHLFERCCTQVSQRTDAYYLCRIALNVFQQLSGIDFVGCLYFFALSPRLYSSHCLSSQTPCQQGVDMDSLPQVLFYAPLLFTQAGLVRTRQNLSFFPPGARADDGKRFSGSEHLVLYRFRLHRSRPARLHSLRNFLHRPSRATQDLARRRYGDRILPFRTLFNPLIEPVLVR